MKKLYKKGTVHPTPPVVSDQLLSFLPATILTLTVALSPEEKQVLAYLISCSSSTNFSNNNRKATNKTSTSAASAGGGGKTDADHPPSFNCYCFRCYMSYWAKWDSSPNRQLIHEVIDAYEESLLTQNNKKEKSKKERRKGKGTKRNGQPSEVVDKSELSLIENYFEESKPDSASTSGGAAEEIGGEEVVEEKKGEEEDLEKGSVGKFVSFLGEKIWGVWT